MSHRSQQEDPERFDPSGVKVQLQLFIDDLCLEVLWMLQ
jgi:hypothetical protein